MRKGAAKPWVRQVVYGVTFVLLLIGLYYAGYVNELLKGKIPDMHRGTLVIGFIVGIAAASSYLSVALAKRLSQKQRSAGRR